MKPELSTRPMTTEDQPFLFQVFSEARGEQFVAAGMPDAQMRQLLALQFQAWLPQYRSRFPNADFDLILANSTPVGYLFVDRGVERMVLVDIAVLRGMRNQGIATCMVSRLILETKTSGNPIEAHVERHNPVQRLWQRLGFRIVDDDGTHYALIYHPGE